MPGEELAGPPFEGLDFLYVPSADVASDVSFFHAVLGGVVVFTIEAMGTRVALIELAPGTPRVLLADHLHGERPVLVFRVADLESSLEDLTKRGWEREGTFDIPQGPCCSFVTPGGHRIALYQLTRPHVVAHFEGRRDF